MTTTTTGTPSPQVRNIILAVAALGLVAFVALSQGFSTNTATSPQTADTVAAESRSFFDEHITTGQAMATAPALPDSVTGFEYDQESTSGHAAGTPVTGEYFGYSGELYPEGHALDQPMVEQPARVTTVDPAIAEFAGIDLPELYAVPSETAVRAVAQFAGSDLPDGYAVRSAQSAPRAAASLPESVTGFEYDHESTPGRIVGTPVTGQYFGINPELDAEK